MKTWGACTIVTASYLAHARVLAHGLRRHLPEAKFYVLIADSEENLPDLSEEPFVPIRLSDLGEHEVVREMTFIYTPFELCCALRGLLHRYLLEKTDLDRWLFLDGDVYVCGALGDLFERLGEAAVTLTPHARTPAYPKFRPTPETNFLAMGIYNGGVLGLRRSKTAETFADWFHSCLRRHALTEPSMYADQLWLNLVPLFFSDVQILDHPGVNVGHWNYHESRLEQVNDERFLASGEPLLLIHFSGCDPESANSVSRAAPWFDGRVAPAWQTLFKRYLLELETERLTEREEEHGPAPYGFSHYLDGRPIRAADRRHYRRLLLKEKAPVGDPFAMRRAVREGLLPLLRRKWKRLV